MKKTAVFTACVALAAGVALAQTTARSRVATAHEMMEGWIKPHSDGTKKALEAPTKTDDTWEELAMHAALLNEASYSLMEDGRAPDAVWSDAVKVLRQGSGELHKAALAKDAAAAKTAAASMGKSCKGCHDTHKKKKK